MQNIAKEYTIKQINEMLYLIPNGITINLSDLKEVYSQEDKKERVSELQK